MLANRIYRMIVTALSSALVIITSILPAVAVETNTGILYRNIITGFGEFNIQEHYITINDNDRPSLERLVSTMPENLEVQLNGKTEICSIPVTWYPITGDYEEQEKYYYQFNPKWDENLYTLSEEFDEYEDVPYIGVFVEVEESDTSGNSLLKSSAPVTGKANETKVYNYLRNNMNVNVAVACGILANIQKESSFNPTSNYLDTNGKYSYGLCQWNGGRNTALKTYCKKNGYSYSSVEGQMHYLEHELETSEKSAWSKINGQANTKNGAYTAGYNWAKYFERCAEYYNGRAQYVERGNLARDKYWPAYSTASDPEYDIDNRYPTPFIVYPLQTSGKVPVYDSSLTQYSLTQHYIAWDDRCTVKEVYANGFCRVSYPTSSGTTTNYTKLSYFISGGLTPYGYIPPSNTDAYTRVDMEDELGDVYSSDNCRVVAESGDKLQVIYPIKVGYKCGWIYGTSAASHGQNMEQGPGRTIADGDYHIVSAADPTYFLDISGTSVPAAEGTNVQLYQTNDGILEDCDVWTITYNEGFYTIVQRGTDRALDVYDASTQEGANVQVWHSKNNSAQQWAISTNGSQGYRLQARCSGFSLDIDSGVFSNKQNIRQWTENDTSSQRWLFIPCHPEQAIEEGRYVLVSASDEEYELDIPGDTEEVAENAGMRIWKDGECLSKFNSFDITAVGDGYYRLMNAASGKVLAVPGDTINTSQVIMRTPVGGAAEEWAVTRDGVSGGYTLRSRYNGLAMDITKNEMSNGTKVIQYPHKRTENQTWNLIKAEHTITYHVEENAEFPKVQTKYYKEPTEISLNIPVKEGKIFSGWTISEDDDEAILMPGEIITEEENLYLYAVWGESSGVTLPYDLSEIEEEAFCGSSVETVVIPGNCTKIGKRAFAECAHLKIVLIPVTTTQITADAFEDSPDVTLYVYENSPAYVYAIEHCVRYGIIQQ